ncbi:MAG TPA: DUF2076 domain-containing protein [Xanthobacteraceae bacterium]|jgi:hypothetical protein
MTPQEQQLVEELFDRLAQVENLQRDPEAERLVAAGLGRAPHALYALTQTALIQDEALKRANARIEELQSQLDGGTEPEAQRGFLDSMREAVLGPRASGRSSVPSVRSDTPQGGYGPQGQPPDYPPQMPPGYGGGPPPGGGGSFLGGAASTAAGVVGGALMLDAIRGMFGHRGGGFAPSGLGNFARDRAPPWRDSAGGAADSQLARDAGIDHIRDSGDRDARLAQADADQDQDQDQDEDDYDSDDWGSSDGGFDDA